jgi:hypothetical protein
MYITLFFYSSLLNISIYMGVVAARVLASHHCNPGLILDLVSCELSLLLILSLASRVLRLYSLHKNVVL